jgi:GIY-YIG catalytic domain
VPSSPAHDRPSRSSLPAAGVRDFRRLLDLALSQTDGQGRKWADARWGCYAFFDYEGEPIYVGQTNEQLRTRVRRHLTNQRTDAVAMRILDVFEVAEMELWPIWDYEAIASRTHPQWPAAQGHLDAVEYSAYLKAIAESRFKAILNEKIPPVTPTVPLPASQRFSLISDETREERGHPDVRIARRAETISRLAAVAHERGEVSDGLRRVLVIQAVRLAYLAAVRLAYVEGRPEPDPSAIDIEGLVGSVLREHGEPAETPLPAALARDPGQSAERSPDGALPWATWLRTPGRPLRPCGGQCGPTAAGIPNRKSPCAARFMRAACGTGCARGRSQTCAAALTWCSAGPAWPWRCAAASGMGAPSITEPPRRTPATGLRKWSGISGGTGNSPASSVTPAGSLRSCGSMKTPLKPAHVSQQ